jgi:hypothetical protein
LEFAVLDGPNAVGTTAAMPPRLAAGPRPPPPAVLGSPPPPPTTTRLFASVRAPATGLFTFVPTTWIFGFVPAAGLSQLGREPINVPSGRLARVRYAPQ